MGDVNETLQELVDRRLRELGVQRGRREPLSLKEAHDALPAPGPDGERWVTYEVFRRVQASGHSNIGDRAARTLARMLEVDVEDVMRAAGKRPPLGRFVLPERADRLTERERSVVVDVIDTIIAAGERLTRAETLAAAGKTWAELPKDVTWDQLHPEVTWADGKRASRGKRHPSAGRVLGAPSEDQGSDAFKYPPEHEWSESVQRDLDDQGRGEGA